ncbi:MAG TPA: MBOAT family O-acyltransferase [Bryobacteraceae bacterium]|jgi:D-alanyl-lipoteichoic acid acyltransferase DltB (MBOAT superfamily)
MQFNSYSYLLLLIPAVALFWALPAVWRRWYVLALSIAYYATWNIAYTPVPLLFAVAAYLVAQSITRRPDGARRWMWGGVALILAVFLFFRYHHVLLPGVRMSVPLGLSFYSFATIAYLIDTRQGRIKNHQLSKLSTFVTFWPTVISGPILRFRELAGQMEFARPFEIPMLLRGLDRLILGLVQKNLIANTLRGWVDEGFLPNAIRGNTTIDNWALAVAFGLEIYFDFAAYSNMAIGAAQLIGVTLPENFRFPYHAQSPPDFWNRWHMSLSRWIRDYLFFPVNARFRGAPVPLYCSLVGIMALVGLWHGAGWGFVLWGAMHGVYLVVYRIWESLRETRLTRLANSRAAAWSWRILTLAAVTAAWVPFRASTGADASRMLGSMFGGFRLGVSYSVNFYLVTLLVAIVCTAEPYLAALWNRAETFLAARPARLAAATYVLRPLLYAAGLLLFLIFDDRSTQFIYFQF